MELDRNYFNSIRLNTRRGKFYDIEAVDRLLVDIRSRADSMNREYADACRKLAEAVQTAESLREENTELFMKGQALSQEVLALRDELKAAQSGEAFVIPENDESSIPSESETSATPSSPEPSISDSPSPEQQESEDDALMPPDIVSAPSAPSPDDYVISSSSPREEADKILAAAYAEAASIRNSAQQLWDSTVSRLDSVFSMIREINSYSIEKTDRIRQDFLDQLPSEEAAPPDLSKKIGRIAEQLSEIEDE